MKYFVTGATGFIGGRLARKLIDMGHQVVTIARTPEKAGDLVRIGVEVHKGDITEKETMRAGMMGTDGVFHVAAWYKVGTRDNAQAHAINVEGTRNVLELMRDLKIAKGVYTSTLAVFGDTHGQAPDETYRYVGQHLSMYDETKAKAHYDVALPMIAAGLPLVIVQPGAVYGPGDRSAFGEFLQGFLQRKLPVIPQLTAFAPAHVDDIVQGHILAMEKGRLGETYIICGETRTLTDIIGLAEQITGISAPVEAPPGLLKIGSALMSVIERMVRVPENYSSEYLRVAAGTTYLGNNAKARRELGYQVRPFEDGLRETLMYEMAQLGMTPKNPEA